MKRLPQFTSLLAVVALSVSLAYWAMQLFKAPQRPINPPAVPVVQDASVEAGASLFGGQVSVATASNYQLKGVVAAGNGRGSVAIIATDGKPSVALPEGAEVVPGVTVLVLNEAGTQIARLTTNDVGSAPELVLTAPDEAYSLDEANTTVRPYAVYQLRAEMTGFQTIELEGVQVFAGQQTVARLQFLPAARTLPEVEPETIPEHPLFAGNGGSGPAPEELLPGSVLARIVVPKKIVNIVL